MSVCCFSIWIVNFFTLPDQKVSKYLQMTPNTKTEMCPSGNDHWYKTLAPEAKPRRCEPSYLNLGMFAYFHIAGLYGLYLCVTEARWSTIILAFFLHQAAIVGVTAGAHRLWAHRTYKAKLPLQIILVFLQSFACQYSIIHWAQDHRLHHKFTDTDADPHNATRGYFYSHIGWLLVKKHPEAKQKRETLDFSDLYGNPLLRFQKKYSVPFIGTICFILPTIIPMYFWGESFKCAWHITILRVITSLHMTFLVNSAAHAFGNKPYDKFISSSQSISISLATLGEGYHNFHHVFPWDYRAAELGNNKLNFTTLFINFFAWIGWAYELKAVSQDVVSRTAENTGDGTNLWGWKDKDLPEDHKKIARIINEKTQ